MIGDVHLAGWIVAIVAAVLAGAAILAARRTARRARREVDQSREEAREAERLAAPGVEAAFSALPLAAFRVDPEERIQELSDGARERFPFLASGATVLEAFGEHELARRIGRAVADREREEFRVRLFVDGRRTYRVLVAPLAADIGGVVVSLTDASAEADYEELRMQFVANVSHELRTPLTGLRGLLEALGDDEMDRATRGRFAVRALHETDRLAALVEDVLLLSELETRGGAPAEEPSELGLAVEAAAAGLEDAAAAAQVELVVETAGEAWTPLSQRLSEVVAKNLLENAVNYAGPGATAGAVVDRRGEQIVLTVRDDGAGIAEEHLPHVFERFYRADRSRSAELGGTGLGLAIVKHVAERFGGTATAASRHGFGTTVTVTLPARPPPSGPESSS
jgi:two-component system phosphate regulon sensor histidine kinase PhoR